MPHINRLSCFVRRRVSPAAATIALLLVAPLTLASAQPAPIGGESILRIASELAGERFAGRLTGSAGNGAAVDWLAARLADAGAEPLPSATGDADGNQDAGGNGAAASGQPLAVSYRQPVLHAGQPASLTATGTDGATVTISAGPSFDVVVRQGTRISGRRSGPLRALSAERATPAWIRANRDSVLLVGAEELADLLRDGEVAAALFHSTRSPQAIVLVLPERIDAIPRGLFLTGTRYPDEGPMLAQITHEATRGLEPDSGMRVELVANFAVREAEVASVAGRFGGGDGAPVVLSAHLDGAGRIDGVGHYPGAADNASGCAVVLEAARQLASARLGRPLWIVFFNGEEQGLYGSRAFAGRYADELRGAHLINVDMVGHSSSTGFVVSGTEGSDALAAVARRALASAGLEATVTDRGLSDHAAFGGPTPAVSIVQAPYSDMHLPSDRPVNLRPDVLAAVAEALTAAVRELGAGR